MNVKNGIRKTLASLLVVVLLLTSAPLAGIADLDFSGIADWFSVKAEAVTEGKLKYEVYGDEATITGCDRSISGEFVIPETLGGYPVTIIDNGAFSSCIGLTSITIPNSVTSIRDLAFLGCTGLVSITIPDGVTNIGERAFYNTAYYNNSDNWENGVLYIGNHLIKAEDSIFGAYVIKDGTKTIGRSAFFGCTGLTSITIPDSITSIGSYSFLGCSSIAKLTVGSGNKVYHSKNNCIIETATKELVLGCKTSVVPLDGSVTSIVGSAFKGCTDLESITIPNGVTSIGSSAFSGCTSLISITILDSVTSIGDSAFYNTAYYNNSDNWENNVLYIGNHLIEAKDSISGAYEIKYGTKAIADWAFLDCHGLTSVIIPNSVTNIGISVFEDCTSLGGIIIPNSVTSIGDDAFRNCTGITSIIISEGATKIGSGAFQNTAYYNNSDNWENGVLYIGNHLIKAEDSISGAYEINGGTKTIADYAFEYCTNLISITIPDSVTNIGSSAFLFCNNLTSVTISDSVTNIDSWAFFYCNKLTSITIPRSVTNIGDKAFGYYLDDGGAMYKKINDFKIYGYPGTAAEKYAKENGFIFVDLSHKHTYTETVTKSATCTETGLKTFTCDCGDTYTEVIPALGHTKEIVKGKPATCTESGLTDGKECSVCGVVLVKQKEIPALGHDIVIDVEAKEPTCTEPGTTEGSHCTRCDYKVGGATIPALGHTEEIIKGKAATCTESGLTDGKECSVCGVVLVKQKEIPALGHDIVIDVEAKDPTCTEPGTTEGSHCTRCDYRVDVEVIPALGHTEEIIKGKPATCTESGLTDGKKCSVCGEVLVKQKEIPALGHDIVIDVEAKKPTCTESGTTEGVHCTRCDYKVEAKEIEPLGHTDEDNDGKCDTCGESLGTTPEKPENPSENCSCACHKKGIAKFFFKIGLFFQKIFKKNKICKCGVWHY